MSHQCYEVLLARLIKIWDVTDIMPHFPTVIQVHQELHETVFMLLLQESDLGYVPFLNILRSLCIITWVHIYYCCIAAYDLNVQRSRCLPRRSADEKEKECYPSNVR